MLGDLSNEAVISFLYMLIPILISLSIHEFAHAYVAYRKGDFTQKIKGRLTLLPFAHLDIVGFICIVLFGFGWGKPVQVDNRNFENRRKDMLQVALAGPLSNLALAFILTILLKIFISTEILFTVFGTKTGGILQSMIYQTIFLNVGLAVFNMLPIPPFDGSKLFFYFLPSKYREIEFFLDKYSFIILIFILVTNIADIIMAPFITGITMLLNFILMI